MTTSTTANTPVSSSGLPLPVRRPGSLAEDHNQSVKTRYEKDRKLGEGTYAVVSLAHDRRTGEPVAIKKIKISAMADGISMDAIREVKFLQELRHDNIIRLLDVFASKNQNLNLVLEFLGGGDLEQIIKQKDTMYSIADMKSWMLMSLRGLWWCHKNFVLHRDIKPNNLLINSHGQLKLADFGLARSFSDPYRGMTSNVVTRWYRAPELLFGAKAYSSAIDIFAMGLVFLEIILRTPYLPGNTDVHQLQLISQALGTPTEKNWPGVTKLPDYVLPDTEGRPELTQAEYESNFHSVGRLGSHLAMDMLRLDPRKRVSAKDALLSPWFREDPPPTKPEDLPKKGGAKAIEKMGQDLKRRAGFDDSADTSEKEGSGRGRRVARKLF